MPETTEILRQFLANIGCHRLAWHSQKMG